MKSFFRASVFAGIGIFVIACGLTFQATSTPTLSHSSTPTTTSTPKWTETTTIKPTSTRDYIPPTLLPTIEPTLIPEMLSKALSIQQLTSDYGHKVQQITGWDYGFRQQYSFNQQLCSGYQWLDTNHLILYPRTGEGMIPRCCGGSSKGDLSSEHAVINLTNGKLWMRPPYSTSTYEWDCETFYWSRELGIIINQRAYGAVFGPTKPAVFIYTFEGKEIARYWGKILGISPSGMKILVDEDTIIDLSNGKITDLAWYMNYDLERSPKLYWSSDETRIYRCCFYYADLKTGKSYSFKWGEMRGTDGKPISYQMHPHDDGQWIRNDSYFLVKWGYWDVSYYDPIPMFSPEQKKYYDLAETTGIPSGLASSSTYTVSPDGNYVWIKVSSNADGSIRAYLVNLINFDSASYDIPVNDFFWSPDGKYGWMNIYDSGDKYILSATDKTLTPFPVPAGGMSWRPNDHVLALFADSGLAILDPKDMSIKGWKLPSTFGDIIWSPDGNRIALVAVDGSLWQADYPKFDNFEQLTPPLPDVTQVNWSPDGNSIAFISGSDIYVVETTNK